LGEADATLGGRMTGRAKVTTPLSASASLTERAAEAIKARILSGELLPGSNHLENELAELLGISRTPVREALLMLEAQGLVEIIPRRGVRIVPLSSQDMEEIYEILAELEPLAAAKAAAKGLSEHQLATLAECLDRMEAALEADDRKSWAEADDLFHRRLIMLSGNRRLQQTVQTFSDQVRRARLLTLHIRPAPHRSNEDHRALFDAIAEGDAERAARIHREHRMMACKLMVSLLAKHGLRSV
jgi:DNA-binding GntR family transcriptional regulator